MKKVLFGILCVLVAIITMSHNTKAMDLTIEVRSFWAGGAPSSTAWYTSDGTNYGQFTCGGGTDYRKQVTGINMTFPSNTGILRGDILQVEFSATSDGNSNNNIDFATAIYDSVGNFDVIDVKYSMMGMASGRVEVTLMAKNNGVTSVNLNRTGGGTIFSMQNMNGVECMAAGNWTMYRIVGDSSQAIINAINNSNSSQAIEDAKDAIVDAIEDQQAKEDEAVENIEDQTPEDISSSGNTENQATTNLIGLFQSFITAISGVNMGNCNITLDFPSYAGGSRVVNICQNKDKAGNLISVFSSLTLIVFYIPLALKLLSMIYNEIRSFTNG